MRSSLLMWKLQSLSIALLLHDIPQMLHVSRPQVLSLVCPSLLEVEAALLPSPVPGSPQHSQARSELCQGPSGKSVCGLKYASPKVVLVLRLELATSGLSFQKWFSRTVYCFPEASPGPHGEKVHKTAVNTHWYSFLGVDSPLSTRVKQQIT